MNSCLDCRSARTGGSMTRGSLICAVDRGAEGTLAVVKAAEVKVVPIPKAQGLVVLSFATIPAGARAPGGDRGDRPGRRAKCWTG